MDHKKIYRRIKKAGDIGIALLVSFLITFLGVLCLAFMLLLVPVSEKVIDMGILILYILSCFVAGRIMRKKIWTKRLIWGLLIGGTYYLLLLLTAVMCDSSAGVSAKEVIVSVMICVASAALGCRESLIKYKKMYR